MKAYYTFSQALEKAGKAAGIWTGLPFGSLVIHLQPFLPHRRAEAAEVIFRALPEKIKEEMKAVDIKISKISRTIPTGFKIWSREEEKEKTEKIFLTKKQYEAYKTYAQQEVKKYLARIIKSGTWKTTNRIERAKWMRDEIIFAKTIAREKVLREIKRGKL